MTDATASALPADAPSAPRCNRRRAFGPERTYSEMSLHAIKVVLAVLPAIAIFWLGIKLIRLASVSLFGGWYY